MQKGRKTFKAVTKLLTICTMISISPCSAQAPGDGDERCINGPYAPTYPNNEKTLMDSYHYLQLLPGNGTGHIIPGAVWNDRSVDGNDDEMNTVTPTYWQQGAGGLCRSEVRVCGWERPRETQNNWLFTQHISKDFDHSVHNYAVNIAVEVIYDLQGCRYQLGCDMEFKLLNYKTNTPQPPSTTGSGYMNIVNYEQFGIARPQALFERHDFTLYPSDTGFYIALQDTGTCVNISRLRVYRYICPKRQVGLVLYPETPAPVSGSVNIDVNDMCVDNAVVSGTPQATCHSNGIWGHRAESVASIYDGPKLRLKGKPIPNNGEVVITDLPVGRCRRYDTIECLSGIKYQGRGVKAYWKYTNITSLQEFLVDDFRCKSRRNCKTPYIGWWSARGIYRKGQSYFNVLRLGRVTKNATVGLFTCNFEEDNEDPVSVNIVAYAHPPPPSPPPPPTPPIPSVSETPIPTPHDLLTPLDSRVPSPEPTTLSIRPCPISIVPFDIVDPSNLFPTDSPSP